MNKIASAALVFSAAKAFEANFDQSLIQAQEEAKVIMGDQKVLRIQIKPTHHLMTDPFVMRMSQSEYEAQFGSYEKAESGNEWLDSIIDHTFLPTDVGHANQSNFDLGTPRAPAGVCLFDNNLSDTFLFQSSVYKDNIAGYDPNQSSTYIGEDNSHDAGPMYGHNA
jgi:hypothetical protein